MSRGEVDAYNRNGNCYACYFIFYSCFFFTLSINIVSKSLQNKTNNADIARGGAVLYDFYEKHTG